MEITHKNGKFGGIYNSSLWLIILHWLYGKIFQEVQLK